MLAERRINERDMMPRAALQLFAVATVHRVMLGGPSPTTLAAEGIQFTDAHSPSTI